MPEPVTTIPAQPFVRPNGVSPEKKEDLASAAQQFEALMIHQLLKSSSGDGKGWFGAGEEDQAGLQAMDLAQEQFATALAAQGGMGLAQMITSQLAAAPPEHHR